MPSSKSFLSQAIMLLFVTMFLSSCKEETGVTPELEIPAVYDSTGYSASVTAESSVRTQLATLTSAMQVGRNMDSTVTESRLLGLWNGTTLRSVTASGFTSVVENSIRELAASSGKAARLPWENAPASGSTGGVIPTSNAPNFKTGYLYDENVLEHEQIVEKGLFFGAMYQHALSVMAATTLTKSSIDRLIEIFGAKPGFRSNEKNSDPQRDRFSAVYAARRSDTTNANSLYSSIRRNLITARAAIEAGRTTERDQALADFRLNWEKVIAATVINYCHTTLSTLNSGNRTDSAITIAMHAYGECVGFTYGLRAISEGNKRITNAQCDEILSLLRAPYNSTSTAYQLLSATPTTAQLYRLDGRNDPNLGVIERLQEIYGFTNSEIESFRRNWVADQNRR
ncbi:MAG: hypothetical protein SFU91_00715 [Chloroherpetonaceae bacterium]|nr:hypothetical protein [Chloroherpetonaceae bacterium]